MPTGSAQEASGARARSIAAVLLAAATFRLRRFEIAEHSMEPVLRPGDWVLGARTRRIRPGHVVVFEHPDRPGFLMVKRVSAVGEGGLVVHGDRPDHSVDSRQLGPITAGSVRARVLLAYHPRPMRPVT